MENKQLLFESQIVDFVSKSCITGYDMLELYDTVLKSIRNLYYIAEIQTFQGIKARPSLALLLIP